jgi:hypothetical protein
VRTPSTCLYLLYLAMLTLVPETETAAADTGLANSVFAIVFMCTMSGLQRGAGVWRRRWWWWWCAYVVYVCVCRGRGVAFVSPQRSDDGVLRKV